MLIIQTFGRFTMSLWNLTYSEGAIGPTRSVNPRALALSAVETVELWAERRHQRHALRELSDHALHDIALSRADIDHEASKPFLRA